MKRMLLSFAALVAASTMAFAAPPPTQSDDPNPTIMIGMVFQFGDAAKAGDIGFTVKAISTNRPNEFVVGGGLSFFPWAADKSNQIGFDLGAGYNFDHMSAFVGYDFLRWKSSASLGYAWTEEKEEPDFSICLARC